MSSVTNSSTAECLSSNSNISPLTQPSNNNSDVKSNLNSNESKTIKKKSNKDSKDLSDPANYYFVCIRFPGLATDANGHQFIICPRQHWDTTNQLDDSGAANSWCLNEGFMEDGDGVYAYTTGIGQYGSPEEAFHRLIELGCEEKVELAGPMGPGYILHFEPQQDLNE